MDFEQWYKEQRPCGIGFDQYFDELIEVGYMRTPLEIKIYMKLAFNAGLQQKETN